MSREDTIRSHVDLTKYGVSEVRMLGTRFYAARDVVPLFIDPEEALAARGWGVVIDLGGRVFVEPWSGGVVESFPIPPGPAMRRD